MLKGIASLIPKHLPANESDITKLYQIIKNHKHNLLVLTGAGVSTESGIPDYRSKDVRLFARSNHKSMTYQEFSSSATARQRYWARSYIGWSRFSSFVPNDAHITLANLEKLDYIFYIVTQNVDRLHHKAGSQRVIELHGTLSEVICAVCQNYVIDRDKLQNLIKILNPHMKENPKFLRPDGDVELETKKIELFKYPTCPKCDGYLKPGIVFFGENVSTEKTEAVREIVDKSNAVLVLGSTLSVYSSYRIVLQAATNGKPIYIVNLGASRGDHLATIRIHARCGEILPTVYKRLISHQLKL